MMTYSRNEDEKNRFSQDPFQMNKCTTSAASQYVSHSPYTDIHVETNQPKRWPSQDSSESNWDMFSREVSLVRRSAAYEPSQVRSRDEEDRYAWHREA